MLIYDCRMGVSNKLKIALNITFTHIYLDNGGGKDVTEGTVKKKTFFFSLKIFFLGDSEKNSFFVKKKKGGR